MICLKCLLWWCSLYVSPIFLCNHFVVSVSIKIILKRILRKQFFSICMWVYQSFLPFILHFIRSTMNILIYAAVNLTIVNWKFSKNQKENLGSFRPDVSSLQQINKVWIIFYILIRNPMMVFLFYDLHCKTIWIIFVTASPQNWSELVNGAGIVGASSWIFNPTTSTQNHLVR